MTTIIDTVAAALEEAWPIGWESHPDSDMWGAEIRGRGRAIGVLVRCYSDVGPQGTFYVCEITWPASIGGKRYSRNGHAAAARQWVTGRNDNGECRPKWRAFLRAQADHRRVDAQIMADASKARLPRRRKPAAIDAGNEGQE